MFSIIAQKVGEFEQRTWAHLAFPHGNRFVEGMLIEVLMENCHARLGKRPVISGCGLWLGVEQLDVVNQRHATFQKTVVKKMAVLDQG